MHELTITDSVKTLLSVPIPQIFINTSGLPVGALFAGFQFRDVSFLCSMEFQGTLFAKLDTIRRQWAFIVLIVIYTSLPVSVVFPSVTLMRPRLDDWPAEGTDFWINQTEEDLWSTHVTTWQVLSSSL